MTAIRLARGYTGRDLLVKFAGNYHGHSDGLLAAAGSGLATLGLPGSAGVPAPVASQTLVVPYNDLGAVRRGLRDHGDRIAGIIVEAAAANMGVVPPLPGYNAGLADIAHENGALLIVDEVLTGFRVHPAGYWGLQAEAGERYSPDLFTFGKVVGGGMPLAALGGRADVMDKLAPSARSTRRARSRAIRCRSRRGSPPCAPQRPRCTRGWMPRHPSSPTPFRRL